jgi:RNA polymerase sigma-70 factor (ECF subfamily)
MSDTTSLSLLQRLRQQPQEADWQRLVDVYQPLVHRWLGTFHLQEADAEDVCQDVFRALVRELPSFQHGPRPGGFRRWLRTIMVNRLR